MTTEQKPEVTKIDTKAGIYHGMPMQVYLNSNGISKSTIKDFNSEPTPAHYITKPENNTPAMSMGTAIHTAVLEPHLLDSEVSVIPREVLSKSGSKAGGAWKAWKEEQKGKVCISISEKNDIDNILTELHEKPENKEALELVTAPGPVETSFFWNNEYTCGAMAKCRPDKLSESGIITDLKTTGRGNADYEAFSRVVSLLKYNWSAAWTMNGVTELTGVNHTIYKFVVIEIEAPYGIIIYEATPEQLALAWKQIQDNVPELVKCMENNNWPCYPDGTFDLPFRQWELRQLGDD